MIILDIILIITPLFIKVYAIFNYTPTFDIYTLEGVYQIFKCEEYILEMYIVRTNALIYTIKKCT